MGKVLSAPITTKESDDGVAPTKGLAWGVSCMQGWRLDMEDAHFALPSLEGIDGDGWRETAAFSVMDGHGGKEVAIFCEQHLPAAIARGSSKDPRSALVTAFHRMDEVLRDGATLQANPDWVGCTCVVCLVRPDVIACANAGDSRAVLSRQGRAVPLSEDHKPNLPGERSRIQQAGGQVERSQVGAMVQFRVNGNLNLSRSIGDLNYKKNLRLQPHEQMVCSTPDVHTFKREGDDEFIIIACDGIWDVLGSQDAVDFVHERLPQRMKSGRPLSGIMEEMLDHCLSPDLSATKGIGGDNMTAMLVVFTNSLSFFSGGATRKAMSPVRLNEVSRGHGGGMEGIMDDSAIAPHGLCGCKPK